jgi:hypothetical protein
MLKTIPSINYLASSEISRLKWKTFLHVVIFYHTYYEDWGELGSLEKGALFLVDSWIPSKNISSQEKPLNSNSSS